MATLVFVHAHPDDEALLTAGTMAKAASAGHRVVLVMATDGAAGLSRSSVGDLARTRSSELAASARILGVARVVSLGFHDSGLDAHVPDAFATTDPHLAAARLVDILQAESADIVVGYDPNGGYGHPDHVQVHRCVRIAWERFGGRARLFEATLPREPIVHAVHLAHRLHLTPAGFDPADSIPPGLLARTSRTASTYVDTYGPSGPLRPRTHPRLLPTRAFARCSYSLAYPGQSPPY